MIYGPQNGVGPMSEPGREMDVCGSGDASPEAVAEKATQV